MISIFWKAWKEKLCISFGFLLFWHIVDTYEQSIHMRSTHCTLGLCNTYLISLKVGLLDK